MGAWGAGSFANDDAMDWIAELEREGLPAAGGALQAVIELASEYLESPVCAQGLAAAEVVAALHGKPAKDLPEEIVAWVNRYPGAPGNELTAIARQAVAAIGERSELRDLWDESSDAQIWRDSIADLQNRLAE